MEEKKICPKCGKEKTLNKFSRNINNKDGLENHCKKCCVERSTNWRARNKEKDAATAAVWHVENRERRRNLELQRKYGIGIFEYDEMLEAQDNGCAICGKTPEENGRSLFVDHDHITGKVRGLLCRNCNLALGYLQDNPHSARSAANYLEK